MARNKVTRKTKVRAPKSAETDFRLNLTTNKRISAKTVGQVGESIGAYYFKSKGYRIIGRNIRFKRGEVDILAIKDDMIRIIEVKSALIKSDGQKSGVIDVTRETMDRSDQYRRRPGNLVFDQFEPEYNFTQSKIARLRSIASEIIAKYPFPLMHMLDYESRPGHEAAVLQDGGEVRVGIEGFAVRIFVDDSSIKTIRVRHYEDLVS